MCCAVWLFIKPHEGWVLPLSAVHVWLRKPEDPSMAVCVTAAQFHYCGRAAGQEQRLTLHGDA